MIAERNTGQCIIPGKTAGTDFCNGISVHSIYGQFCRITLIVRQADGSGRRYRVLPFIGDDIIHRIQEIAGNSIVPSKLDIGRQFSSGKVHLHVIGSAECGFTDIVHPGGQIHSIQLRTVVEGISANVCNAIRDQDIFQRRTVIEGIVIHIGNCRVAEVHTLQIICAVKGMGLKAGQCAALFKNHSFHFGSTEQICRNIGKGTVCFKCDFFQISAIVKYILCDLFHRCRNRDIRHSAIHKGIDPQTLKLASR